MTRRSPLVLVLVGTLGACTETDHDGPPRFFATEFGDGGALVEVDTGMGTVRRISGHGLEGPVPHALAFEASTGTFYALRGGEELVRIDAEDFTVTRIGPLGFTGVRALTLDESAGSSRRTRARSCASIPGAGPAPRSRASASLSRAWRSTRRRTRSSPSHRSQE